MPAREKEKTPGDGGRGTDGARYNVGFAFRCACPGPGPGPFCVFDPGGGRIERNNFETVSTRTHAAATSVPTPRPLQVIRPTVIGSRGTSRRKTRYGAVHERQGGNVIIIYIFIFILAASTSWSLAYNNCINLLVNISKYKLLIV